MFRLFDLPRRFTNYRPTPRQRDELRRKGVFFFPPRNPFRRPSTVVSYEQERITGRRIPENYFILRSEIIRSADFATAYCRAVVVFLRIFSPSLPGIMRLLSGNEKI